MNFDNMNNNDGFERALEIIRRDSQNRPVYGCCQPTNNSGGGTVGPTGPIGPTERLFKSSNRIIIDSS